MLYRLIVSFDNLYYLNIQAFRDAASKEGASKEEIDFYDNIREELDFDWTPTLKLVNKGETISEYTYLSEEYYEIKGSKKKEQAKENKKYIKICRQFLLCQIKCIII